MNILKYLIARSPKITRAVQKPSSGTSGSGSNMAPRFNRSGSGGRVKRRQQSSSMLAPPLHPGQTILQPLMPLPIVNPILPSVDLSPVQPSSTIQVPIPPAQSSQEVLSSKQPLTPESPIAGTQSMPFSSMAPLTIQTQQQHQLMQQEQQSQKLSHLSSTTSEATTVTAANPQVAIQGSPYFTTTQKQPLMSLTPDEQRQAFFQLMAEQQQQQQALAQMMVPRSTSSFRDIPCSYFLSGSCIYGDKCWYSHVVLPTYPVLATQQPLLSPQAGQHSSVASHDVYTFPQQPAVDQNLYYMSSPPQSPVAFFPNSPTWPIGGNRSSFMHYPGGRMPGGAAHPNNSRFMLTRYPVNPAALRVSHSFVAVNGPQVAKRGEQLLKFSLISEIPINSEATQSPQISHLTTRGDHFYITFGNVLRDYRIMLQQPYKPSTGQTYSLKDTSTLPQVVSCLYCSRDTGQLFIGTENGSIYRWDTKHNERIDICTSEVSSIRFTNKLH